MYRDFLYITTIIFLAIMFVFLYIKIMFLLNELKIINLEKVLSKLFNKKVVIEKRVRYNNDYIIIIFP